MKFETEQTIQNFIGSFIIYLFGCFATINMLLTYVNFNIVIYLRGSIIFSFLLAILFIFNKRNNIWIYVKNVAINFLVAFISVFLTSLILVIITLLMLWEPIETVGTIDLTMPFITIFNMSYIISLIISSKKRDELK